LNALHDDKKIFWKKSNLRVVCPDCSFEISFDDFSALENAYAPKIHLQASFLMLNKMAEKFFNISKISNNLGIKSEFCHYESYHMIHDWYCNDLFWNIPTSQGQLFRSFLKDFKHSISQRWSSLQAMMHRPRTTLLLSMHSFQSAFWFLSSHWQNELLHSSQPLGQFDPHGQSLIFYFEKWTIIFCNLPSWHWTSIR